MTIIGAVTHLVSVAADFMLVVFFPTAGAVGARLSTGRDGDRLDVGLAGPVLLYQLELTLSGLTERGVDSGVHFLTKVSIGSLPSIIILDDKAVDETDHLKICESFHDGPLHYSDPCDELINTCDNVTSLHNKPPISY